MADDFDQLYDQVQNLTAKIDTHVKHAVTLQKEVDEISLELRRAVGMLEKLADRIHQAFGNASDPSAELRRMIVAELKKRR